uniref:Limb development membrane protein 1 like n=1 Tax=Scleropages formosus TaxID=113540 RepID=A0A8C9VUF2_SCLFO
MLWLCTFSLSVSIGAILLLPLSILSNEVLLSFPDSYYMQWLNGSLVHGLWNLVFLFSNLSLVFLLPFAYLFTESEGFVGSKKGVMARVYETAVVLLLLSLLVLGMVWVASALVHHSTAQESLNDLWEYYVPYLYSCISLFGMLLLLLCTPFGQSRMFSVTGNVLVKPRLLENVEDTMNCAIFEEASLSRKLTSGTSCWVDLNLDVLKKQFLSIQARRMSLGKSKEWEVLENVGCMSFCFFFRLRHEEEAKYSMYLMVSSVVGFYSSPLFTSLLPRAQDTNLTEIIGNCVCLLVLSSALPVFSRILGITRFDLLGDFGRYNWLGNFYIVFLYNMLFAGLTSACLIKTVTWAVQRELICAFGLHKLPLARTAVPFKLILASGLSKVQ